MSGQYLTISPDAGDIIVSRNLRGAFTMMNLLRFRPIAGYSTTPDLAPEGDISGRAAYQLYIDHTLPFLRKSGGDISFLGTGGRYLIGPPDAHWDLVMMIRQNSYESFQSFASNSEYLAGFGHRQAALEDSRLLPLEEFTGTNIMVHS